MEIRNNSRKLEKRLAAVEGQLAKMAIKKDLKAVEKRLMTRFDELFDALDQDVMENRRRLSTVEEQLGLVA